MNPLHAHIKQLIPSKQHSIVWILCVWGLFPNILATLIAIDLGSWFDRLLYFFLSVVLFLVTSTFLKTRAFFIFQSLFIFLGLIEVTHLVVNQATSSILFTYTILIAEPGEAFELFTTSWPILLILLMCFVFYYHLVVKKIKNDYLFTTKTRLFIAIIALFTSIIFAGIIKASNKIEHLPDMRIHPGSTESSILQTATKVFPINLIYHTIRIAMLNQDMEKQRDYVEHFTFGIKPQKNRDNLVILVIGETARYGNFGINGYARNTTPRLSKRTHFISMDSIYSVANLTTVSVPFILSPATPLSKERFNKEKSVVEAFAEAGYKTAWIANQSFGNKLLMRISTTCDYTQYLAMNMNTETNYDIKLVDKLNTFINLYDHHNQFIVLHSLGCHFKYNYRYPSEFSQFLPDMNGDETVKSILKKYDITDLTDFEKIRNNEALLTEAKTLLINSYDNAILYTDYFLDSTISALEKTGKSCVLLYLGDHGENLLDDDRHLFLHGTYSGSAYEYHVPLFIWYSEQYKRLNPNKIKAIEVNKSKKTSTMVVFNTLLELANIHYPQFDYTKSLTNPAMTTDSIIWGLDANLQTIQIPTDK